MNEKNVSNQALDSVAIEITREDAARFQASMSTDAQKAVITGIQDDKSASEVNTAFTNVDPLVARLVNNGVANAAEFQIDPSKTGEDKWYITTPFQLETGAIEDDGTGCCVGLPSVTGCRFKLRPHLLCVKDQTSSMFDELMEAEVKTKGADTKMPWAQIGDSIKTRRAKFVAEMAKFIFARNVIQGTPGYRGEGLRPFGGLVSRLLDPRTFKLDGSGGFISTVAMLDCRLTAMGGSLDNFIMAVNPIAYPTLRQEVFTFMKTNPMSDWTLSNDNKTVNYKGVPIITSRFIDVDLDTNTTSMWLIDESKVGIKMLRNLNDPFIKTRDDSSNADDCAGSSVRMFNAGTTVVKNFDGLALITNIRLDSVCDSASLGGLKPYINQRTLYPGREY